jgi:hypothetical protein
MIDDERRVLELLAGSADGCTDALLTAQGFKLDVLISVVSAGLATAKPERVFAGGKPVEITRVRITDAGRLALAGAGIARWQLRRFAPFSPSVCVRGCAVGCHTARNLPVSAPPLGQPSAGLIVLRQAMTADERRLLELLVAAEDGCTDALLFAHGFALEVIFNVVKAGLATAQAERLHAASQPASRDRASHRCGAAGADVAAGMRPRLRRAEMERTHRSSPGVRLS